MKIQKSKCYSFHSKNSLISGHLFCFDMRKTIRIVHTMRIEKEKINDYDQFGWKFHSLKFNAFFFLSIVCCSFFVCFVELLIDQVGHATFSEPLFYMMQFVWFRTNYSRLFLFLSAKRKRFFFVKSAKIHCECRWTKCNKPNGEDEFWIRTKANETIKMKKYLYVCIVMRKRWTLLHNNWFSIGTGFFVQQSRHRRVLNKLFAISQWWPENGEKRPIAALCNVSANVNSTFSILNFDIIVSWIIEVHLQWIHDRRLFMLVARVSMIFGSTKRKRIISTCASESACHICL